MEEAVDSLFLFPGQRLLDALFQKIPLRRLDAVCQIIVMILGIISPAAAIGLVIGLLKNVQKELLQRLIQPSG